VPSYNIACWSRVLSASMGDAVVGIIGMGDMGKMYAKRISNAGWRYANLQQKLPRRLMP